MNPIANEIAKQVLDMMLSTGAGCIAGTILERFQKPLVESLPALKHLDRLRRRQLEQAFECLNRRLSKIERIVENERALGFANMCFRYFEAGAKEHREIKLKMLAAACAATADADNSDSYDISLDIWDAVETMQPFDVRLLRWVRTNAQRIDKDEQSMINRFNPAVCSFKEIASANWDRPQPKRMWLAKSILRMNALNILTVEGGSMAMVDRNERTQGVPLRTTNDELLLKVQRADIGVSAFGEKILQRLKRVTEEN